MVVGIGLGLFLVAAGAILTWAVSATTSGLNIHVVGVILMLLGIALVALDLIWLQSWSTGRLRRTTYVDDGAAAPVATGRRVVVEEDVPTVASLRGPQPPP